MSQKPETVTEETWQGAGNAGVYVTQMTDGVEIYDGCGYCFPEQGSFTVPNDQAEAVLSDAVAHPWPDPTYYTR